MPRSLIGTEAAPYIIRVLSVFFSSHGDAWTARNSRDPPGGSRTVTQTALDVSSGMTVKCEFGAAAVLVATSFLGKVSFVSHLRTVNLTAVVMPRRLRRDQMPVDTTGATGPFGLKIVILAKCGKYKRGVSSLRRRGHRTHRPPLQPHSPWEYARGTYSAVTALRTSLLVLRLSR